jgi:hypothetical protein
MTVRGVHRIVLIVAALLMSALPSWISGIAYGRLLSSDAEWYVALAARISDATFFATDRGFAYAGGVKPGFENALHWIVIAIARVIGTDLASASVVVSAVNLVAFVLVLYWLLTRTMADDTLAFVVALALIIPVHALAATTLGVSPLGFLPRDLALTVAIGVLGAYFAALDRKRGMWLVFLSCGLFANFLHARIRASGGGVVGCRSAARTRRLAPSSRRCRDLRGRCRSGNRHVGALPPRGGAGRRGDHADAPALHADLSAWTGSPDQLSARLIYVGLLPFIYLGLRRYGLVTPGMRAWLQVALAALLVAAAGVVIENTTTLWPYHLSRASVFFLLSATVVCTYGLATLGERLGGRWGRAAGVTAAILLLLIQSNVPSVYRHLEGLRSSGQERRELLDVADWLRTSTSRDAVVLAPSTEQRESRVNAPGLWAALRLCVVQGRWRVADGRRQGANLGRPSAAADQRARQSRSGDARLTDATRGNCVRRTGPRRARRNSASGVSAVHRVGRFVVIRVV